MRHYIRRSLHGFTLVEVMVAMGVASIGMMGILQLIEFSNRSQKSVANNLEFMNTKMQLQAGLASSSACGLRDSSNASIVRGNWTTALNRIVAPWGTVISQNQELNGYRYSLTLSNPVEEPVGSGTYTSFLTLKGDRVGPGNVGAPTKVEPPMPLRVTFDGAGNVTNCAHSGSSSASLPASAPAGYTLRSGGAGTWLADSAIFVDGSSRYVGIGTTNPSGKLELGAVGNGRGIIVEALDSGYLMSSYNTSTGRDEQFKLKHSMSDIEISNLRGNINFTGTNVGIGTTLPSARVDIKGANATTAGAKAPDALRVLGGTGMANSGAGGDIVLTGGTGPASGAFGTAGEGGVVRLTGGTGGNGSTPARGGNVMITGGTGGFGGGATYEEGGDVFIAGGTPGWGTTGYGAIIMNAAGGRVGMGTSNPMAKLDIKGLGNTSASLAMHVRNSSDTSMMYFRNDGNVGIGTTAPATMLDVNGGIRPGTNTVVSAACTPALEGTMRYNTTNKVMEFCSGSSWVSIAFPTRVGTPLSTYSFCDPGGNKPDWITTCVSPVNDTWYEWDVTSVVPEWARFAVVNINMGFDQQKVFHIIPKGPLGQMDSMEQTFTLIGGGDGADRTAMMQLHVPMYTDANRRVIRVKYRHIGGSAGAHWNEERNFIHMQVVGY